MNFRCRDLNPGLSVVSQLKQGFRLGAARQFSSSNPRKRVEMALLDVGLKSPLKQALPFQSWGRAKEKMKTLQLERTLLAGSGQKFHLRKKHLIYAMDASFGGTSSDSAGSNVFPRINVRDPYKRLGISTEASEQEIQKFYDRKNPKINVKKKVREFTQHPYVQAVTSRFQTPSDKFMLKTSVAFLALGALTVLFPTEEGPTLQVAISLLATIYFIHSRLRSKLRAFLYGVGTFIVSWLLGTFLMVSVIPPLLKGPRSLEVMTSLLSYVLLWVSSTYLK
ncbi:unnamed protein product [Rhodiola kirilowii]